MEEFFRWNISIPRALYNDLKHMSFDEGVPLTQFCKPALEILMSELVKLRDQTVATRKQQIEEAQRLAQQQPENKEQQIELLQ